MLLRIFSRTFLKQGRPYGSCSVIGRKNNVQLFFSYVGVSQPAQVMFVFSEITSEIPA